MGIETDNESEWAARLARTPFALAWEKSAPVVAACGNPPQIAFATAAALQAFGAADAAELQTSLFSADTPSGRRFRRLAVDIPEEAPPRLERLRYVVGRKPVMASWLCARLRRGEQVYFVAAEVASAEEPYDLEEASAPTPVRAAPVPAPPPPVVLDPPARFVWRLDAAGRFSAPDAALAERAGPFAPRAGETLEALSERLGLDAAWRERVAARESFSQLALLWPEPPGEHGRVVSLSGAPAAGGYRGFGLWTGERRALARAPRPAEIERPAPVKPIPGDAAALLNLLQRQHGGAPAAPIPGAQSAATAPALAIISALAALLQPKAGPPAKTKPPEPAATGGAEIVRLRPNAPEPAAPPREAQDSVALTSKERDAFKEIARALGVNVRAGREAEEAPPAPPPAPTEDDLAALIDMLPLAALVTRDGEALYANRTLLDLAGYADLAEFRARDGLNAMFRGRDPQTLVPDGKVVGVPLVAAGGEILTADAQTQPAFWHGAPARVICLRRSREAEHQAELRAIQREAAMHAARARDYAAALDAARDGMVRLDRSGRILGMNRGAEKLFGYDQKEAAGDSFLTLLAPPSQGAAAAALERVARGEGALETLEAVARSQDGRQIPVRLDFGRLAAQPDPEIFLLIADRSGETSGARGAHAALEEAEKANLAKTELLSRVSHEIRTPLHAILGFAEVILEERFGPIGVERYRDYLRDILASGRHVLSLANDLLDFSRVELGKTELEFAPLDVNAVVRDCVALMQPQAARERVIMRLSLFDRLPNVMADARSLKQIMLNLMANAVKYNEPGGQVIVSTAVDDAGQVVIRVRDTGVGMNDSELAVALEPFRRVPGGRAVEGSGLGLPLAKALVEANHADFSIKSRKDQGTLVEIAFPVRRAAQ
jgi:PAS domain S-box-containing protein